MYRALPQQWKLLENQPTPYVVFLFYAANIQVSRRYFPLFHLPGNRNPYSISSYESIEAAQAACPQSKEGQQHPSQHWEEHCQQVEGWSCPSIQPWWDTSWVLGPVLYSPVQETCGHSRVSPAKGHKDDWDWTVQPEEKKDSEGILSVCVSVLWRGK